MIKVGKVSSVNNANFTAKVAFINNIVSYDLPVVQNGNSYMPKVGDSVVCLFMDSGIDGFILGSYKPIVGVKA